MKVTVSDMIYVEKSLTSKIPIQRYFYEQRNTNKIYTTIKQTDKYIKFPRNETKFKQIIKEPIEFIEKFVTRKLDNPIEISDGIQLRDYQKKTLKEILFNFKENRHDLLIEAITGWGKTYFLPFLIKSIRQKTLILVDLKFLQQQMYDSFKNVTSKCDIQVVDKNTSRVADVNIATLQLLRRNRSLIEMFKNEIGLVVLDEAHIAAAETISDILQEFPAKYRIGLSATPSRSDGLDEILYDLFEYKVQSHFESGIPINAFIIESDFTAMKETYQETINYLIDKYFLNATKLMVDFFVGKKNRPTMVAVNSIELQNKLAKMFDKYGVGIINSSTSKEERESILEKYEKGEINVLIGYKILNKGINIPKMQVLINLFGATTKENIEQLLGRLNRPHKDKNKAIYIDFVLPFLFHRQTTVKYKTLEKLKSKMGIKVIKTSLSSFIEKIA